MNTIIIKSKQKSRNDLIIENVSITAPDAIYENAWIRITEGKISEICSGDIDGNEQRINGTGKYLLPGFIDLYSNILENYFQSGKALLHLDLALQDADRRLAASGITTAFYGVPFLQTKNEAQANSRIAGIIVREISKAKEYLNVNTRVHAQPDIADTASLPRILESVLCGNIHWLSFRNRTHHDQWPVGKKTASLIDTCRVMGIPVAIAGADSLKEIQQAWKTGIRVSLLPATNQAVQAAAFLGLQTVTALSGYTGDDNSTSGSPATNALLSENSRIICSGSQPGNLLQAINLLYRLDYFTLTGIINMVSLNPAVAAGIDNERGSIETGKYADLVLADMQRETCRIEKTFINGVEIS